ncbi:MAG: SRPBCC family protein [Bacteroidota bacterium]
MKSINPLAPVKCSKTIQINANTEKIWLVLTNIDHWADWQPDISKPKLNGPLAPSATFDWTTGGAKIHSRIHTLDPFMHFGWTGKSYGMNAIHNWKLIDMHDHTLVAVEESLDGFLAHLFKRRMNKNLATGMQNWLELLKSECEKQN